jgi:apolipoprotein N-acyltransferase
MIPLFVRWREALGQMSTRQRFALALLFGVCAGGAMAPFHLIFLLVPGFSGLVWLLATSRTIRSAFSSGWAFGIGHFAVGFYWISHAFLVDAATYGWMAPFAVLLLAAGIALFPGFTALVSWRVFHKFQLGTIGQVLVLAASWIALEWVRSWIFTGFPWNLIGTVWAFSDTVMQVAAYGGVYGLGLITIVIAAMPAVLADGQGIRSARLAMGGAILGLAFIVAIGTWRLSSAGSEYVDGIRLRLVQPNIPQHLKWKPGHKAGHVKKQVKLSTQVSADGRPPTHIIWAETAVPFNLMNDKRLLSYLGAIAPKDGYLITGAPRSSPPDTPDPVYWNSLHAIAPGGAVAANYDKIHLVPFGEYVPFRDYINISKLTVGRIDFSPGNGARVWKLPGLPAVAPLICYEAIFPSEVTSLAGNGEETSEPDWLLNVTNDAWFGMSAGPYQHFAAVRFRAIEMGLPLVRVANTGISAVVDAFGRVETRLDLGVEGALDSRLPKRLAERPLYGRFGDWITLILVLAAMIGGILLKRSEDPANGRGS